MPPSRQWQAALSLLWAASHQGHNKTEEGMGVPTQSLSLFSGGSPGGGGGTSVAAHEKGRGASAASAATSNLGEFLRTVPHFYLLSPAQLAALADFGMRRDYAPGEVCLHAGEPVSHVRVILTGVVDVVDGQHGTVATMEGCSVFGLDSVIVGERAPFTFVCSYACSLLLLPANEVLRVLQKSPVLRQSIGRKMSGQMSCFRMLKDFSRLLFSHDAMKYEYLPLQNILESYNELPDSVVHRFKSRKEIDITAFLYATRRLPDNICRVFSLDLVRSLPPFLATRMRVLTRKAEKARLEECGTVFNDAGGHGPNSSSGTPPTPTTFGASSSSSTGTTLGGGGNHSGVFASAPGPDASSSGLAPPGEPSREIRYVHTAQRRRCVWQLGIDGKNIVLMRDNFTDYLDFVLCLMIHMIEASKLRARLQCLVSPSAIDVIEETMQRIHRARGFSPQSSPSTAQPPPSASTATSTSALATTTNTTNTVLNAHGIRYLTAAAAVPVPASPATAANNAAHVAGAHAIAEGNAEAALAYYRHVLQHQLRLTEAESEGIVEMWGGDSLNRLHDLLMHREEYLVRADSSIAKRFHMDHFHDWALAVRGAVVRRLCLDKHSPLPDNLTIDIVFGFTRGFLNCLSPCARMYRDDILEYGKKAHPEVLTQPWSNEEDMLYALIPDFLSANPDTRRMFNAHLEECGIEILEDTALTGLQADIICTDLLDPAIDLTLQKCRRSAGGGLMGSSNQSGNPSPSAQMMPHSVSASSGTNTGSGSGSGGAPNITINNQGNANKDPASSGEDTSTRQHSQDSQQQQQQQQQKNVNVNDPNYNSMNNAETFSNDSFYGSGGAPPESGGFTTNATSGQGPHFLINIDYTFGAQAEGILKTLASVFGQRIRSINILGKIAGFKGTRVGDVIVADNLVSSKMSLTSEDHMDEFRTVNNHGIRVERLQEFLGSKRKARRGSVLNVGTAMLCSDAIIQYYKNVWGCCGFDIESSYFARMIKECKTNGLLRADLPSRHVYLVRELPEEGDGATTFARDRLTAPVLSAQYAIVRSILDQVLKSDDERDQQADQWSRANSI